MKRVLMLAFEFPPIVGVAVERTLRFVGLLPEHGWVADVVTIKPSIFFPRDDSTLATIPPGVQVVRTGFLKLLLPVSTVAWAVPKARRVGFKNFFAFPDFYVGWLPFLLPALRHLLGNGGGRYAAVYTTSPPVSTHVAGRWVRRRYRIPWVADFRDPWVGNPILQPSTRVHRAIHERLEAGVVADADAVIANTETNGRRFAARYPRCAGKIRVITNGYDEAGWAGVGAAPPDPARMILCHAGTLFPQYDPAPLLAALAALLESAPEARHEIRLRLFGSRSEREAIRRFRLADVVEEHPWRPRHELLRELAGSDVLVLCMSGPRAADFWVPAKTYAYLRAGKPVLALVPPGDARDILRRAGVAVVCDPNDVGEIAERLGQLYKSWKAGALVARPDWDFIRTFEGRHLTGRLAAALDGVTEA